MCMKTFTHFLEQKEIKKTYSFSSVLFRLPENLSQKIITWGKDKVSSKNLFTDPTDPGYGREEEIHCTVLYGLHSSKSNGVRNLLKRVKPFKVRLGKISFFTTSPKFDVIKIEVISKELHRIHELIRDNSEVTMKFPEYRPHVTIAYLKKNTYENGIDKNVFSGREFEVDTLLFSSKLGTKTPIRLTV